MISYQPQKIILTGDAAVAHCANQILASVDLIRSHLVRRLEAIHEHVRNTNLARGTHDNLTTDGLLDEYFQLRKDFEAQLDDINTTLIGISMFCIETDQKE